MKIISVNAASKALVVAIAVTATGCSPRSDTAWRERNNELIRQHNLEVRELPDLPDAEVASNLEPANVTRLDSLTQADLHPGVKANIYWGSGTMVTTLQLAPGARIPEETLSADRLVFVLDGSIDHVIDGATSNMTGRSREEPDGVHSATPKTDFIYLEQGTVIAVTAGPAGARLLEVNSPLRLDYLRKAGITDLPTNMPDIEMAQETNVQPGKVYDLYDIQLTELATGAFTRLVSIKNTQLSFISMHPNSVFPHHIHPEEQMMLVLRGSCEEGLLDKKQTMKAGEVVRIPGSMVHAAEIGEFGCDALDIFWPARSDYLEKQQASFAEYRAIIPEDAVLELVVDGKKTKPELHFAEGPKWMNGKIYFSNMYFDQAFNASPARSSTVELDPSGVYRNITQGKMQTNGLYPYRNGNLIVCDMMGHRVVEMTTGGRVVKVLADKYDGRPIDGPNDVVTDAKGGFYFTDPQFTMEPEKFQPGRAVYYVSPEGKIIRLTEPNEFAMPNGILLSPDGKTLYINNCYDDESWYPVKSEKDNFVWAYDVNADGSVSNGRKFAKLHLTGNVLDRKGRSSGADGMAIDKAGNLYVATFYGVQIFDNKGRFIGMINLPSFPVSLCFGEADMKTLYIVSYSKVFRIRTNMEGFVQYL
jgi:gluconolactonase